LENPDDYFCNPKKCFEDNAAKCDGCFCRFHMEDIRCKCKSNPYSRDCFCMKNPLSHLCNPKACTFNPNSLFCACQTNLRENMCTPSFCAENPESAYCKCIVDPYSDHCSCLNDPNSCSKKEFMQSIVDFDLKIRDSCTNNKLFYSINPFKQINDNNLNNTNYVVYDNNVDVSIVDPQAIFNMYYPPCSFDHKDPSNKVTPCIPFPEPPKPCKGTDKNIPKNLLLGKPCVWSGKDGTCVAGMKGVVDLNDGRTKYSSNGLLRNVNSHICNKKNTMNLVNIKRKFNLEQGDQSLLMLYNKALLFNQVHCQELNKD